MFPFWKLLGLCWVSEETLQRAELLFCLSCVTGESRTAFACLHVGVLHVCFSVVHFHPEQPLASLRKSVGDERRVQHVSSS